MISIITAATTQHWVIIDKTSTIKMVENKPSALADIVASDFDFALGEGIVAVGGAVVAGLIGLPDEVVGADEVVVARRVGISDGFAVADGLSVVNGLAGPEEIDALRLHVVRKATLTTRLPP